MAEPALAATPPNDFLTRKFLRRSVQGTTSNALVAALEQLATDSVYVLKDDFDYGLDERIWVQPSPPEDPEDPTDYLFTFDSVFPGGRLRAHPGIRPVVLLGRDRTWRASRRAAVQGRLSFSTLGGSKFEFGFADISAEDVNDSPGVVNVKSTPSTYPSRVNFALAVRDTDHNTSVDLVCSGSPAPVGQGSTDGLARTAQSGPAELTAATDFTLMIAVNEQREARFWINGNYAGLNRSGPYRSSPLAIWLLVQHRVESGGPIVSLDYIQAWQERVAV